MEYFFKLEDIKTIAHKVLENATSKTLLFYGEMGVGKTTLIKEIAHILGVKETLTSPTYSIINEYEIEGDKLYHFDLYRLNSLEEAYDLGIEDYLNSNHWNLIEWPEKIENILPNNRSIYTLTKTNLTQKRKIKMTPMD